jgi:histidine transport system permease protein
VIDLIQTYWKSYLWSDGFNLTGLAMTLWLLVLSCAMGFVLAIPLAVARTSRNPWLWRPVWLFTYVFRGTPLFVQLLLIYTGFAGIHLIRDTPLLWSFFRSGFNCVIVAFVVNTCAYTTEIFAGAIRATPYGEIEAGQAIGMSRATLYRRVILPSSLRRALPAYSNEVIFMLHSTSIAFTATVPDLLKVAVDVNAATYMTFQAYGIAAAIYLGVTFLLVGLFRRAERRWLAHLRPQAGPAGSGGGAPRPEEQPC